LLIQSITNSLFIYNSPQLTDKTAMMAIEIRSWSELIEYNEYIQSKVEDLEDLNQALRLSTSIWLTIPTSIRYCNV
jgi:hypothetical protein